ncbi:hypothetical protein MVEG_01513 [Podila verticillata NRRL 6337]|nr:hypothetical protein MVEG_01513 [Podila verticillata NRRL 6337]
MRSTLDLASAKEGKCRTTVWTVEGLTVMAMIFSQFTIELVNPNKQPGYLASVALQMSGGLSVRVQRRFVSE